MLHLPVHMFLAYPVSAIIMATPKPPSIMCHPP